MDAENNLNNSKDSHENNDENVIVISPGKMALKRFLKNKLAIVGFVITAILVIFVVFGPFFWDHEPNRTNVTITFTPPFTMPEHPLGTDELGRDIMARLMAGGRVSLSIGLASAVVAISFGTLVGALAGYYGKWVDSALMRLTDIFMTLPSLPLLIALGGVFSPSPVLLIFLISILFWMTTARLVRSRFLTLRTLDYVMAAKAVGCKNRRIIFKYLLPNSLGPIIVTTALTVGRAIIMESTLSFLGVGLNPPTASWGNMLQIARLNLIRMPSLAIIPGMLILLTVLAINFLGDGLNDALDPKQSR